MKHAYVSLVLTAAEGWDADAINQIDRVLDELTAMHEIVLVAPYTGPHPYEAACVLSGPLSIVITQTDQSPDGAAVAGLTQAAGDFVLLWRGAAAALSAAVIGELLAPTDAGVEIVEALPSGSHAGGRLLFGVANRLRDSRQPLRASTGLALSQRAARIVLQRQSSGLPLPVILADLPLARATLALPPSAGHDEALRPRLMDSLRLLLRGTRFGTVLPLALAVVSGLFGVAVALYAIAIAVIRGHAPEGWVTLMIVTGLGQAAILTMLALMWSQLQSLSHERHTLSSMSLDVRTTAARRPSRAPQTSWE